MGGCARSAYGVIRALDWFPVEGGAETGAVQFEIGQQAVGNACHSGKPQRCSKKCSGYRQQQARTVPSLTEQAHDIGKTYCVFIADKVGAGWRAGSGAHDARDGIDDVSHANEGSPISNLAKRQRQSRKLPVAAIYASCPSLQGRKSLACVG